MQHYIILTFWISLDTSTVPGLLLPSIITYSEPRVFLSTVSLNGSIYI